MSAMTASAMRRSAAMSSCSVAQTGDALHPLPYTRQGVEGLGSGRRRERSGRADVQLDRTVRRGPGDALAAVRHRAVEDAARELTLQRPAHVPAQRAGAELLVEALACEALDEPVIDVQRHTALGVETLGDLLADHPADAPDLGRRQRLEGHDLVDPVQELGQERGLRG